MTELDARLERLSPEKRKLLALWAQDAAEAGEPIPFVPARTEVEQTLAAIWEEVLEQERVGVDDNYFALGGDSILAIIVVAKAQQAGFLLTTQQLFARPTIAQLAKEALPLRAVSSAGANHRPDPTALVATDGFPLTPMQEGMVFHTLAAPGTNAYVTQVRCRIRGRLDFDAFERAWADAVTRHAVLRTSFGVGADGRWRQHVVPEVSFSIERRDARGLSAEALAAHLAEDRRLGFDLARPPLLRVAVLEAGVDDHWAIWTHHHLLLDGWSQQLLLEEVLGHYEALVAGGRFVPAARRVFEDYVHWLEQEDLEASRRFWRDYLDGVARTARLGAVPPATAEPAPSEVASIALDIGSTAALGMFCRRHRVTVATAAYGAWALILGQWNGSDDVIFGVTISARPSDLAGADEMLGVLINTLPLRVKLQDGEQLAPWLQRLQVEHAEVRRYERTPLVRVQSWSDLPAASPLFESIAVFENFPTRISLDRRWGALQLAELEATIEEHLPLVVEFTPGERLAIRIRYDGRRFRRSEIERLLAGFTVVVAAATEGRSPRLGELLARLRGEGERRRVAGRTERAAENARRLRSAQRRREDRPG